MITITIVSNYLNLYFVSNIRCIVHIDYVVQKFVRNYVLLSNTLLHIFINCVNNILIFKMHFYLYFLCFDLKKVFYLICYMMNFSIVNNKLFSSFLFLVSMKNKILSFKVTLYIVYFSHSKEQFYLF